MIEQHAEATVERLAANALGQVDELVEEMLPALVAAEAPGYYDEEGLADLHQAARIGIQNVLAMLAGAVPPDQDPLEVPRQTGRRQVQQALDLEDVLTCYRIVGKALWRHFVKTAREGDAPVGDALLDGVTQVWSVIDLCCVAAAEGFRSEHDNLRDRQERVRNALLASLLDGRGTDPQFARDATHALDVPLRGPFVCVVELNGGTEPRGPTPGHLLTAERVTSVWTTLAGTLIGLISLGDRGRPEVRKLLAPTLTAEAGMSPVFTELAQLPQARHLAETAARCQGLASTPRVVEDDFVASLVVEAPSVAAMLHEQTVGALLAATGPDGPALLESLRVFLSSDRSLNTAAAKSFVHRNTLMYRLNKIEKLTGYGVRSLSDQVLWVLALKEHENR